MHAVGSNDHTRSHFESMAAIEHGEANGQEGAASGWLGRYLAASAGPGDSPVRAVSFSNELPDALRGAPSPIALTSLTDFRLRPPFGQGPASTAELHAQLAQIYAPGNDAVQSAGRDTHAVLDALNRLDPAHYKPRTGTTYPSGELSNGLRQVACLTKANLACLDHRGPYLWDTHVAQGAVFAAQVKDLGTALAAFVQDLGPLVRRTTIVVMTEFGRRLQENSGFGTDHGRASVMLVLGGRVRGGRVYGQWPGLADDQLEPPGDLRVTTDYRQVLAVALARGVGFDGSAGRMRVVFPGFEAKKGSEALFVAAEAAGDSRIGEKGI